MAEQPVMWRQTIDRRLFIAAVICGLWIAGIEMRLVYLQTIAHKDLAARAERQQMRTLTVPAKRGEIYDRRGQLLAFSVDADTIYAVPVEIANTAATAAALCGALEGCDRKEHQSLVERLGRQRAFVYVKRRVSPTEARKVADLNLEGVGFMKESRRFYPNKELAAHVVGYVGLDNVGLHGLEASYDKVIRGHEGTILVQTDAKRRAFSRLGRVPTSGGSLELTIDDQLQYMVERELRIGVESSNAAAGTAIAMNPRTGEVLAMANWPTFNPNAYNGASEEARRNRAVQDLYEPGSTFKIVTASAAIEEHVLPIDSFIDTSPGVIRFGNRVIDEYAHKNYGVLSFSDVLVKSSNIGAIKIGLKIGPERLGLFIRRFGFGRPTSSDFPAESPGIVWDASKLNDSALASISMGYQVGVTPLQMAAAVSAVANGGQWIEPRVVQAVIRDGIRTKVAPTVVRTAITAKTAAALLPILEAVVKDGTGGGAEIPGYTVAGKTGTADKLVGGRYSQSQQNVSFAGFVPSRNPAVTVVVMIDSPRALSNSGGRVAAPIFKRIAEAALRHLGVPPDVNAPPPVMVARRSASPITQTSSATAPAILTMTADAEATSSFPDLRGLSARDALRLLSKFGVAARMEGKGLVVSQTPAPGTALERGTTCTLVLERDGSRLAAMSGAER